MLTPEAPEVPGTLWSVCTHRRPWGSMRIPSGLEKVSPFLLPVRLAPPDAQAGSPASRKISQLNLVASGESPSSRNFRIWPWRLVTRGLAGSVTRRLLLLVSVTNTALLSGATVIHSGRSITVPPATRAADWQLISTSAWLLKLTIVGAGGVVLWLTLPGSDAPAVRPFWPTTSARHSPVPSPLKRAT